MKKKFIFILLCASFVLLFAFCSISFGYSLDDYFDYCDQLLDEGQISNSVIYGINLQKHAKTNIYNAISNDIGLANVKSVYSFKNSTSGYGEFYIETQSRSLKITNGLPYFNGKAGYHYTVNQNNYSVSLAGTNINLSSGLNSNWWGLYDTNTEVSNWNGSHFNNLYQGPTFSPVNNGYIPVTASNGVTSNSFIRLPFSYTTSNVLLGNIINVDNCYEIDGFFGPYVSSDIADTSQSNFVYKPGIGVQNGSLSLISYNNGAVYINTDKLIFNQGYTLLLEYKSTIDSAVQSFAEVFYFTYNFNNVPSSGDLVNPLLENDTDIQFINSFFNDIDNQSNNLQGNIPDFLSQYFYHFNSGDFSGDIFGNSGDFFGIGYNDIDNWGLGDFVLNYFGNTINLLYNYDDIILNFGILGNISSATFKIPEGELKLLIGLLSNSIILIGTIFWYFRLISNISILNIDGISQNLNVDKFFNMF